MRYAKSAVALALGLCTLAGCGGQTQPGTGGRSTAPATATTPASVSATEPGSPAGTPPVSISGTTIVVPPGVQEVPPEKVDASALPEFYTRKAWGIGDGRQLQVFGVAGGCKEAKAEVTGQSADAVHVTLVTVSTQPPSGTMCTQELRNVPLIVQLDAPLGDRRVVLEARQEG